MRILVPLDGSVVAEAAVTASVRLLQQTNEPRELVLMQAITDPQSQSYLVYTYPATEETPPQESVLLDEIATAQYTYLTHVAHRPSLRVASISATPVVEQGEAAETICSLADRQHADLIVLTSHGRAGIARLALGGVAESVARSASVPTLILPGGSLVPTSSSQARPLWLVPVDRTPFSEAALPHVVALARRFQVRLRLYAVCSTHGAETGAQEAAERYLTKLCQEWGTDGLDLAGSVGWGDAAEQILVEVTDHPCDLIAMATHGRTGVPRLFWGSVTETILHHGKTPVLIVCPQLLLAAGAEKGAP